MVVDSQSRWKNISIFRRPKKPAHAALSAEHPFLDIERTSFASAIRLNQPGHR
jgi:gamma-glutamyl:cysteine ligase YbdK (ATP-grasp superfamily)